MPDDNAVAAVQEAIPEPEQSLAEYRSEREGKEVPKPAESGAETPKPAAASEAAKPEVQKPEEEADKTSRKLQKRFDELTKQREEERERADRLEREFAEFKRRYEESQTPKKADSEDPEPQETEIGTKYTDWNHYFREHNKWLVRSEIKAARTQWEKEQEEAQKAAAEQSEAQIAQENQRQFASGVEKAISQHDDFHEVMRQADSIRTPNDILNALVLMGEEGPEIGYQLGKNPELMKSIAANYEKAAETGNARFIALAQRDFWGFVRSLSPEAKAAAAEAQKAEAAKAEVKPPEPPKEVKPKPVSQAPEPIKPVAGGSGPAETNLEEEGTPLSEYRKARESGRYR